jgi:predicted Zn-dependent peptidase
MDDVRDFYQRFYNPCNAILCVAGNVNPAQVKRLAKKWFGPIPAGTPYLRNLPEEPVQTESRSLIVERDVPFDVITLAYHMGGRLHSDYYTADLLSDVLSSGDSSRLYQSLVKNKRMFTEMDAYISGDIDNGLFMFYGKPVAGVSLEQAQQAISEEIELVKITPPAVEEMEKVQNRAESGLEFSNLSVLNKAMKLSMAELLGDIELANDEISRFRAVKSTDCTEFAKRIFTPSNCSTLFYKAK